MCKVKKVTEILQQSLCTIPYVRCKTPNFAAASPVLVAKMTQL